MLNIDGIGHGRTLDLFTHGFDGLDSAAETVADRFTHPIETTPTLKINADQWPYVEQGIPGIQAKSTARRTGRGWGHTRVDTIDKLEWRNLREQAILLTELTVELASEETDLPHRDTADLPAQLEAEGLADGMKRTGRWSY
jgi:Zn-dependent M28 family amino/carboxypeptidase